MLCDINPDHGEMQTEPMYEKDGITIRQYGDFCQATNCDGYGGPANKKVARPIQSKTQQPEQLDLFEKE